MSVMRPERKRQFRKYNHLLKKPNCISNTLENPEDFDDFVTRSTLLADKSDFLYAILDIAKMRQILLTLPSGWGKTTLLTMAKSFFSLIDVEDKENMENENDANRSSTGVFDTQFENGAKFRIMHDDFADFRAKHFHAHPTIFIDCSAISGDYNTNQRKLNKKIWDLLDENKALLEWTPTTKTQKRLANCMKAQYLQFLDNSDYWEDAINSLTTLMHLKSGGQKVIILIDGYDSPIINQHRFADSNEFNDSLTLVNDWIQAFVSAKNVELLLVVGTFWFPLSGMNFHHFGVDESRPPAGQVVEPIDPHKGSELLQFFGLKSEEFDEYCQCYNFDEGLKQIAREHYNGLAINGVDLYRTNSVIKMFKDWARCPNKEYFKFMKNYSSESKFMQNFLPLFRSKKVTSSIKLLLGDEDFRVDEYYCASFQQEQLKQLRQHAKSYAIGKEEDLEKNEVVMLVMQFLLGAGSLIRIGNKLIIPNNEQRNILQFYITEYYYKRRYAFDIHLLQKIADQLKKIVFGGNEDPKLLIDALSKMYNAVRKDVAANEHHTHVIFEMALMLLEGRTYLAGDYILGGDKRKDLHRPDIIFCSQTRKVALCVELKYGSIKRRDKRPEYALNQIAKNGYITKSKIGTMEALERIIAIGMNAERMEALDDVMEVRIELRMKKREDGQGVKQFLTNFEESLI